MLVNGKWTTNWQPVQAKDAQGRFVRQVSSFRNWITADGSPGPTGTAGFKAEAGRYRLFVALICPWASRTLIARKVKGLEALIPVTVVNPVLTEQGWAFGGYPGADTDPVQGAAHLHELYSRADPGFTGRATVPILWDSQTGTIVSNESADILRMFDTAFAELVPETPLLYPARPASPRRKLPMTRRWRGSLPRWTGWRRGWTVRSCSATASPKPTSACSSR